MARYPWRHVWSPRRSIINIGFVNLNLRHLSRFASPEMRLAPVISPFFSSHSLVPTRWLADHPSRPLDPPGRVNSLGGSWFVIPSPTFPVHHILSKTNAHLLHYVEGPYYTKAFTVTGADSDAITLSIPGGADPPPDVVAGPRYEDLPDSNQVPPIKLVPACRPPAPFLPRREGELAKGNGFQTYGVCVRLRSLHLPSSEPQLGPAI